MTEIELSTMQQLQALGLADFERETRTRIRHHQIPWTSAWSSLLDIAVHMKGPDVSEIGSTWLGSLAGMNALRPFQPAELDSLAPTRTFAPSLWTGCQVDRQPNVLAVPFTADTRLIHYRRDLLQKAGVDEVTAFQTPEHMAETLERLRRSGVETPLTMPTTMTVFQNLASWVWGAGGHFRSEDGHRLSLDTPQALNGSLQFFGLHRWMSPAAQGLEVGASDALFRQGQAAVALSGQWLYFQIVHGRQGAPEVAENLGLAQVPGVPFVGGTCLVVWKYALRDREAVSLVNHLTRYETQRRLFQQNWAIPVRADLLESAEFKADPHLAQIAGSIRSGRCLHISYRWAAVETRLSAVLNGLWADLFANPALDLPGEIARRYLDLKSKLERTILAG